MPKKKLSNSAQYTVLKLINRTLIDWDVLRTDTYDISGLTPSSVADRCPLKFTPTAEYLIFVSCLLLGNTDEEAHNLLINVPRESLNFIQYTFLMDGNSQTLSYLRGKTGAAYVSHENCILATGSLAVWYDAIILNLTRPHTLSLDCRLIFDKMFLMFERDGLSAIFTNYNKKTLEDGSFVL